MEQPLQEMKAIQEKTRRFMKRNWVAFMIVNISELEEGNDELYMHAGNLNITMVSLRIS